MKDKQHIRTELEYTEQAVDHTITKLIDIREELRASGLLYKLSRLFSAEGATVPETNDPQELWEALEQRQERLVERLAFLEEARQKLLNMYDEAVQSMLALTDEAGELSILRNTDPFDNDPELLEEALRIQLRFRVELEKTRYDPLRRLIEGTAEAVQEETASTIEQYDLTARQIGVLKEMMNNG